MQRSSEGLNAAAPNDWITLRPNGAHLVTIVAIAVAVAVAAAVAIILMLLFNQVLVSCVRRCVFDLLLACYYLYSSDHELFV
jgi:hypothetical protein